MFGLGASGDTVTDAESQQISASFQSVVAAGGIPLQLVKAEEVEQAIESMPEEVRAEVRTEVQGGTLRLAWVSVRDTHAEDGDIVSFKAEGVPSIDVEARNAWKTVAIPYPPSGHVGVTGVRDGGGGITVAIRSGAAEVAWPTMQVSDTFALPVTPGF